MQGNISEHVIIDKGVQIDPTAKIYHFCVIRDNVKIGAGTVIGHGVVVERDTTIGNNVTIQSQCHITGEAKIGNNVFFGPGVIMTNEKNIANQGRTIPNIQGPIIGNGVRIGAGSIICPGVRIGSNSFIYAGTFVRKDIPAGEKWGMVGGKQTMVGRVPESEWL